MNKISSVQFFDTQFQRQISSGECALNPFETMALPYLHGHVLDFGCGLGNLAIAAAQRGCSVVALDASQAAIQHLRHIAATKKLPIEASVADLKNYVINEQFDTVVSIGLLMFFDCTTALHQLMQLQEKIRPGGIVIINVLVKGTNYLDMFDAQGYCLFERNELMQRFAGWETLHHAYQDFPAPNERVKSFTTIVARKPLANGF